MTRRDETGTTTSHGTDEPQQETQETQDSSKGEARMSDSQAYLQESPEATRTPAIWSDCLIVALVWLVCLTLSIQALREEVNTIIDFMMVSSPLERHKALYILTNKRQHQTQCKKTKAAAHEATNLRTWQGRTS